MGRPGLFHLGPLLLGFCPGLRAVGRGILRIRAGGPFDRSEGLLACHRVSHRIALLCHIDARLSVAGGITLPRNESLVALNGLIVSFVSSHI